MTPSNDIRPPLPVHLRGQRRVSAPYSGYRGSGQGPGTGGFRPGPGRREGGKGSGKDGGRWRRWAPIALAVAAMLVGLLMLLYPLVSDMLLQAAQGNVISAHTEAVQKAPEDDLTEAKEFAEAYNRDLLNSRTAVSDPFDPARLRPQDGSYEQALNIAGDGVMGTVVIPAIHVNEPIYHGVSDEVLQKGVGHLEETSLPIGGESSHCVLSGHTGLPSGEIFDHLDELEVGDYFVIQVLGEDHAYRIYDIEVVLPDETQSLVIQLGRDLCTLVTCTPYGVNSHRLLVHAERCELPDEWTSKDEGETYPEGYSAPVNRALLPAMIGGIVFACILIAIFVVVKRVRRRRAYSAYRVQRGVPPYGRRGGGRW